MKIINISIERFDRNDDYYTNFDDYKFYTKMNYCDSELKDILDNLNPNKKDVSHDIYSCSPHFEPDLDDIKEKLKEYEIYPLDDDLSYTFKIPEEEKWN